MQHFQRCERKQHRMRIHGVGSRTKPLARHWRLWLMFRIVPDVVHFVN